MTAISFGLIFLPAIPFFVCGFAMQSPATALAFFASLAIWWFSSFQA